MRNNYYKGFLKRIIYRVDFQLITKKACDSLYTFIYGELHENFTQFNEDTLTNDEETGQKFTIPQDVYTMKSDDKTNIIIGRSFVILDVYLQKVDMGIEYNNWFATILKYLKEGSNDGKFIVSRLGVRKFNRFYFDLSASNSLNDIFNNEFIIQSREMNSFAMESYQLFNYNNYMFKFTKSIDRGFLSIKQQNSNKEVFLVKFDYDVFTTDRDQLLEIIGNPIDCLNSLQDAIYKFHEGMVKSDVIEAIIKGELLENKGIVLDN